MTPIRFGLVGYGLWGTHHARAIENAAGAQLVAVAASSGQSLAKAAEAHPGVSTFADYRELIGQDDVDLVDITVPNHLHYPVAKAALQGGKHVLLEKPMTLRLDEADELIDLARCSGKLLAVNHELRLSRLWGQVKTLISQGTIGRPMYVLLELSRFPYRRGSQGWRYDIDRVGNWILEEPIHFFDLACWYLNDASEPVSVFAQANSRQAGHPELQDNFVATVTFSDGAIAVVCQTLAAFEHHVTCKVTGTGGAIWAAWSAPDARSPQPNFSLRYGTHEAVQEVPFDQVTGEVVELAAQIAAVVRAVREGKAPPASGEDGRRAVAMCLAAASSAELRTPVAIQ